MGFHTPSVSAEPMLDTEQDYLHALVRPLVTQSIWFGLMNMPMSRLAVNHAPAKVVAAAEALRAAQYDEFVRALYERYKADRLVKWKDSIKEVLGLVRPTEAGLDV
jgi:hypothetical protein